MSLEDMLLFYLIHALTPNIVDVVHLNSMYPHHQTHRTESFRIFNDYLYIFKKKNV